MKFLRLTVLLASISGLALFTSCGGGGGEDAPIEKTNLALLSSKTWKISKASFGTTDGNQTTTYQNMTITISGTFNATPGTSYNYSVAGLPTGANVKTPWPRANGTATTGNGTWHFSETNPENTIYREDTDGDLAVAYTVTKDKLHLEFNFGGGGYRTSSVSGNWVFDFVPQ